MLATKTISLKLYFEMSLKYKNIKDPKVTNSCTQGETLEK